jgi:hypothetical protein
LEVWLNDFSLAKLGPPRANRTITAALRQGENVLLCKSSAAAASWQITAEFADTAPNRPNRIHQVPAAELPKTDALAPPPPPSKTSSSAGLDHAEGVAWRLLAHDDFNRHGLGDAWRVVAGKWVIRDGVLQGEERSFLSYVHKLPPPLRIEYDARSPAPADLSAFWLRNPDDQSSGYLIAFAAGTAGSRIQIEGDRVAAAETPEARGLPNRWQHVIVQVLPRGTTQLIVDGRIILSVPGRPGSAPPAYPGLWTWGGGEFDNVRIFGP